MTEPTRKRVARAGVGVALGCLLLGLLASCGLAESVAEGYIDDQDYELYAGGTAISTLVRQLDGTDVGLQQGVLLPGDRSEDDQALALLAFGFDRQLQPNHTRLEWIRLRFWASPGDGDITDFGPLLVTHIPDAEDFLQEPGSVPNPPGVEVATVGNVATSGWREVDVTQAFLRDWTAGRSVSAFAIRFATPTDGDAADDFIDLDPEIDGEVKRTHLVLHFGVDL